MSFDYEKVKSKSEDSHGNSWTAYSDLFMMLSTVFLLLYVSVSLRSQTSGIEVHQKVKQLTLKNADLEEQLQVYNALRDNHLKNEASQEEGEVYKKLMNKLTLLQDEAKGEKDALRKQAKENEDKEYALNEYQKIVRNIINTNMLSKTQLKHRDIIIDRKNTINTAQKAVINSQSTQIEELNDAIAANEKKIKSINDHLKQKIKALHEQQEYAEISKSQMNKKIAELKTTSEKQLRTLKERNQAAIAELEQSQKATLQKTQADHDQQIAMMKQNFTSQEMKLRNQFESQLNKERVTGAERAKRLADYAAQAKARTDELNGKLKDMGAKIATVEAKAASAEAEKGRALASVQDLQKSNQNLSADLKHAQEMANARGELASRIKSELKKAGLTGTVDGKTGDVTLSFGEEYFDTGSSNLKPSMESTLKKFMPGYSKSLFSDQKIAGKIENVEIIGFASSTYKGKYVPPNSLRPQDREAINYNLKLSFNRANAIFKHIFDTNKMSFEHQRDLLPKIKVVGRGYLPDGQQGEIPNGLDEQVFCKKYNCKQAQKVIIKFKLKD